MHTPSEADPTDALVNAEEAADIHEWAHEYKQAVATLAVAAELYELRKLLSPLVEALLNPRIVVQGSEASPLHFVPPDRFGYAPTTLIDEDEPEPAA